MKRRVFNRRFKQGKGKGRGGHKKKRPGFRPRSKGGKAFKRSSKKGNNKSSTTMLAKPEPRRIGPKTSIIGNIWCFYKSYDTSQQDHWNSYVAQEGCTNRRTDQSLENLCLQYFSSLNPCFLELASSLATPNLLWFRFV